MQYRKEIDGLRAIAVLPVIFFHAGFEAFAGGFVGVDVFFVISGYLISTVILREMSESGFTLTRFYERRARRILPALLLVMLCCVPFAWIWMSPTEFKDFGQSLVATTFFASNVLFWLESGYFAGPAELKPLLHTWSLAVEEQYYLLFPLFMITTWQLGTRWMLGMLGAIAIVSLFLAQLGAINSTSANFYLLHSRGWELLLGVFAGFYLFDKEENHQITSRWIGEFMVLLGVMLIVYSVITFSEWTPYPSFWTLLPTVGTLLIILFSTSNSWSGKLLSLKPLAGIGLISYSLYLWHQPLFALARSRSLVDPDLVTYCFLIAVAFLLAYLSWRYVENPFRNRSKIKIQMLVSTILVCSIFLSALGLSIHLSYEPSSKIQFGNHELQIPVKFGGISIEGNQCSFPDIPDQVCELKGDRADEEVVYLVGDSHARVLSESFFKRREGYSSFYDLTASGCPFLLNTTISRGRFKNRCTAAYQLERLNFIKNDHRRKTIVLSARWPVYFFGTGFNNTLGGIDRRPDTLLISNNNSQIVNNKAIFNTRLVETINEIDKVADRIIIVMPTHTNGWDVVARVHKVSKFTSNYQDLEQYLRIPYEPINLRLDEINQIFHEEMKRSDKMVLINPIEHTCDITGHTCFGVRNDQILFADEDHLSSYMNDLIVAEIYSVMGHTRGDENLR